MSKSPIKILIADDHPIFLLGLRNLIEKDEKFQVISEASDGEEALRKIKEMNPDIAVLDIDMPKMKGLEIARRLKLENNPLDIIILTLYKDEAYFNEALNLDVKGYALKESVADEIVNCLHAVSSGDYYISPAISKHVHSIVSKAKSLHQSVPGLDKLTAQEKQILKLLAENKTSSQIADELHISPKTVQNHRSNICTKLDLQGYNKLLQFAIENKHFL